MQDVSQSETWTIKRAFEWTRDYLTQKGDEQARLSTEWLLSYACGLSRIDVYTQFDKPLSVDERTNLREAVRRRAAGEPLQYIVGEVGFRHLTLEVRPGVLIPRPETEVLVDLALEALPDPEEGIQLHVLDLCTGSGCVGLSLAFERPDVSVIATDICPEAVSLANDNALANNLSSRFLAIEADLFRPLGEGDQKGTLHSPHTEYIGQFGDPLLRSVLSYPPGHPHVGSQQLDLLEQREVQLRGSSAHSAEEGAGTKSIVRRGRAEYPLIEFHSYDLIVSNPPYIPMVGMDALPKEVADFEPALALDGGEDGLDIARRILEQAPSYLKESSYLIQELDVRNVALAADFAVQLNTYKSVNTASDLTGRVRFVLTEGVPAQKPQK